LAKMEKENVLLKAENKQLKAQMDGDKKKIASLEHRLVSAESANKSLSNKVAAYADMKQVLENDLDEKELALNAEQREKLKTKQKYKAKIVQERDKVASELVGKFNEREKALAQKHGRQVAKLNALKNLINDDLTTDTDDNQDTVNRKTTSDPNLSAMAVPGARASRHPPGGPWPCPIIDTGGPGQQMLRDGWITGLLLGDLCHLIPFCSLY